MLAVFDLRCCVVLQMEKAWIGANGSATDIFQASHHGALKLAVCPIKLRLSLTKAPARDHLDHLEMSIR